jgi:hypothetical protein
MSKLAVSAAGGAMPAEGHKTRRALLTALASVPALAIPAVAIAATASDGSAEIIALSAEISRRVALGAPERVRIQLLLEQFDGPDNESPHWDAFVESEDFEEETELLFERLMAIPATTQASRAAKVRAFLVHCGCRNWRGPADPLDWEPQQARALLAEFAGMSAEEIANV